MPKMVAPQPAGKGFHFLTYPGTSTHQIEIVGKRNRPASVRLTNYDGNYKSSEKISDVLQDDVRELMALILTIQGFPSVG
ncbi:hypothetical protein GQ44DRAFT_633058 [Phaeosphaeriaceae sp. PMI808]|nr:hypothetical protein GQ44DRAFT_633058 [Phaeosphaeriaceae sp. PMI808]